MTTARNSIRKLVCWSLCSPLHHPVIWTSSTSTGGILFWSRRFTVSYCSFLLNNQIRTSTIPETSFRSDNLNSNSSRCFHQISSRTQLPSQPQQNCLPIGIDFKHSKTDDLLPLSNSKSNLDSIIFILNNNNFDNDCSNNIQSTLLSKSDDNKSPDKCSSSTNDHNANNDDPTKASEEQLSLLSQRLVSHLPHFFQKPHDFRLYNRNIIFEDNIRNVRTAGLNAYAWQIAKIKMGAHFKYGKVSFNILKITQHPDESTIKIRWRIVTYPGNAIVFAFWRFKIWNFQESIEKYKDDWIDGFSIMQVGGDGLIHKHICDKVMPNEMKSGFEKDSLAVKLGMA